jgi:single-strand DNA-binding protein
MDTNSIVLFGRLGRDPELREMPNGDPITSFALANSSWKRDGQEWKEDTGWFECTAFGDTAKRFCDRAKKGHRVIVTGSLKQRVWKDKDDNRQERISIAVRGIQFLEKKPKSDEAPAERAPQSDVPF